MSFEQMVSILLSLGLSQVDAQVYLFLAPKIPQKASDIANVLKMNKQQLYPCLKNLQNKRIITSTGEHPKFFSALPIENVIDILVKANLEEAKQMEENRRKILSFWQAMIKKDTAQ